MKLIRSLVTPLVAAAFIMGCSEVTLGPDSSNDEIEDALVGSWTASSIVVTNNANAAESIDLKANGGSITLTLGSDGTYTGTFSGPGENESFSGTYVVNGFSLTLREAGEADQIVAFTLVAGVLTLTMDDSFDFDDDGTDEAATMVISLLQ